MAPISTTRYSRGAILLHWLIAAALAIQIGIGLWMVGAIEDPDWQSRAFAAIQLHKSIGLSLLVLTLVRIVWRLAHRPPPLPDSLRRWEMMLARVSHAALYVLMLALPLTGWALVSTSPLGLPTSFFGLFDWPHIAILKDAEWRDGANRLLGDSHKLLAWMTIFLLALHITGALKHQFLDGDDFLARMLPSGGRNPVDPSD